MKKIILFGIILTSFTTQASAFLPRKFEATFEQAFKSLISGKMKKSNGTLVYQYPGKLRLEVKDPDPSIFVRNREKTFHYRPPFIQGEKGDLTINSSNNNPITNLLDVLSLGIKTNKTFEVETRKNVKILNFRKEAIKEIGVKQAELVFKKPVYDFVELDHMNVTYEDDKKVMFRFISVATPKTIDQAKFTFEAPKNTNVNQ